MVLPNGLEFVIRPLQSAKGPKCKECKGSDPTLVRLNLQESFTEVVKNNV